MRGGRAKDASTEESNSKVKVNMLNAKRVNLDYKGLIYYEETI